VSHADIDWTVSFEKKQISGSVTLGAEVLVEGSDVLILDASDSLAAGIKWLDVTVNGEPALIGKDRSRGALGVGIKVAIPAEKRTAGSKLSVTIPYTIGEGSTAIQFLSPEQTAGKAHPYLFTQCQAIHARSLLPCQDTPGARVTYTAKVTVPSSLTALMSALRDGSEPGSTAGTTVYKFNQPVLIPTYLIALAVGQLVGKDIGPRSTAWSEPCMIDAVADEFAETESFIAAGEALLTPYVWTRYDVLCLPPSFPYGGMENPCLTFVTPTIIAGDRSLADVVIHEIVHSWCGNLVTTKTWEHFWLNEGCTMWVQRKIMAYLRGPAVFDFDAAIGLKALQDCIDHYGPSHKFTALVPDLSGDVDPDDAFSSVPYEKGFFFLYYLQTVVGGAAAFDPFFREYIKAYSFKTLTSEEFKSFFLSHFAGHPGVAAIDWDTWYHGYGGLPVTVSLDTSLRAAANALAAAWIADGIPTSFPSDFASFTVGQKISFFDELLSAQDANPAVFSVEKLQSLAAAYGLPAVKNMEIRFRWARLAIRGGDASILPVAVDIVTSQGRMKFTRPIYRDLFKSGFGKQAAVDTFTAHAASYHPITHKMVAVDLGVTL